MQEQVLQGFGYDFQLGEETGYHCEFNITVMTLLATHRNIYIQSNNESWT